VGVDARTPDLSLLQILHDHEFNIELSLEQALTPSMFNVKQ
jgi:hypothetical protein